MSSVGKKVKCIDWTRVVMDLEARGMTMRGIAAACGYPGEDGYWPSKLKNIPGTQPNFHEGAMLLGLWAEKSGKPLGQVPRAEFEYVRNASGQITAIPLVDRPVPI